jgi:subtilase family serine protease
MRLWKFLLPFLVSSLCFAAQSDRITGTIDSSQMVALTGNVHGFAQPRFDLGRTDGSTLIYGVTLAFRLSAAQQTDLNNLLAQQQQRSSPNYHKWLTPAQFGARFGMSQRDINRVETWLESKGFTVTSVANSRNLITFDGTVAQIESAFDTEIHNYLVDSEIHFANSNNPSVPAALAASVLAVGHLHNFAPRPRLKFARTSSRTADPHFTSAISGNHFLAPGDFATIYGVQALYSAGFDGTGESIAVVGQSTVNLTDLSNFRSAAGLPAKAPQLILYPSNSTAARCPGDEGESDLDLEWSGGVAKNANIIFVYAGLVGSDTCGGRRSNSVWNALQQIVDNNYAPVISTSYGSCESSNGSAFANEVRGWVQQANTQGQTVMAASGDSGAADCDGPVASATLGLAVDVPAAIPEVTGMGGTEFFGDAAGTVSGGNASTTTYWTGTTGGVDTISSALSFIPEMAWNDTAEDDELSASGGGASIYFTKPVWQTGTGVPSDGRRDVPDLALNASPNHDGYLFCSEDGSGGTVVSTCTSGFRTGSGGDLTVVGGTSCAAPTFSAIAALLNEYLVSNGFQATPGLGNANPNLYYIATNNPSAMSDVTTGSNIVPCAEGSISCPATAPFQFGFEAGTGYDQVTGLGSVNADALAVAWGDLSTPTTTSVSPSANSVFVGTSVTFTATVKPSTASGTVSFYNNGSTTALGSGTISSGTASFATTSLPIGANSVVATYGGINAPSSSPAVTVTVTGPDFTLTTNTPLTPASIPAGQSATAVLTVAPVNGSTQTINFTNSATGAPGSCTAGLPAGALCSFNPASVILDGIHSQTVSLTVTTVANMTVPSGLQTITVTGTASGTGGTSHNATPSPALTITPTNQTFTIASTSATYQVSVGQIARVPITVTGTNGFIVGTGAGATTALPIAYTCIGVPALGPAGISYGPTTPTNALAVTVSLATTPATSQLRPPVLGGRSRIVYALLLPGLFGVVLLGGFRGRRRLFGLIVVLGLSTLWLGSCSGNSGNNNNQNTNTGTPTGTYIVTINASTGGANPLTNTNAPFTITLQVSAQ